MNNAKKKAKKRQLEANIAKTEKDNKKVKK